MEQTGYTYPEAARELNTTVNTIKKAVTLGNLHPIKIPGERNKYISVEEVNQFRGKSLLAIPRHFEPAVAPAPVQSEQAEQATGSTVSNERLLLIIQFIQTLFGGITSEAGKVSSQLISAALGSSRFNESIKELENFVALAEAQKGVTPLDIGEFIQRLDAASSKDLRIDTTMPNEMKVKGATFLAEEAQRQKILQPA